MAKSTIRHIALFLAGILFILLPFSCKQKKTEQPVTTPTTSAIPEYPVSIIPSTITTSLSDQGYLYPLDEDFTEDFLKQVKNYQGEQVKSDIEIPADWGLICVEHLPEGRELWMIQSQNREWIYLVMTSGMGTQRIFDLIPVAVNLAVQNQDILETEVWTTQREADGAFVVEKKYEWIRSIADVTKTDIAANPEAYQKETHTIDKYYINEMSRFDYEPAKNEADYDAIVFYYNEEDKPEEWDDYISMLQSYCEEKNIFYEEVYTNYNSVRIRDYKMNDITELDITPYIGISGSGMIMFKSGVEPKEINFGNHERMKVEIKRYFKLLNQ